MQLLSDYREDRLEASVYHSKSKAKFIVITNYGPPREFYTESEAEDYAEDFVMGETEWQKQTQNFQ